jgi:hypothetical protein
MQDDEMHFSPPITVLAFMAVLVAAAVWYAPPQSPAPQTAVMLPQATYDLLVAKGKLLPTGDGRPRSAAQVIEVLAGQ